ncbi:MAG: elongation factor P maturation arginine rhamnosyltransferase EarP [Treponemataceae bacterium]|nr:elongation factor P maturation arginine rhamnosyltransferase EarP [Treponemataceae bacterium]
MTESNSRQIKEITILCKVLDNFGDIGVVYRLCRSLSDLDPSLKLNLVVSDLETFRKMAGDINPCLGFQTFRGWNIFDWNDGESCSKYFSENPPLIILQTFQCGLPDWLDDIIYGEKFSASGKLCKIVNIEYLTAEKWADDFHLLKGAARTASARKYFFMPGFTEKTGGLILDKNFTDCLKDKSFRKKAIETVTKKLPYSEEDFKILVFSYPKDFTFFFEAVSFFADKSSRKVHVYVAPGAGMESFRKTESKYEKKKFSVDYLPYLSQEVWDAFLCSMDFLFIRGEDSFARASLTGIPFLWNIYQQDQEFHLVKLKAFLDLLQCKKINEMSWLYNRNFQLECGSEACDAWGKISECKNEDEAQKKMAGLLKEILLDIDEIKPRFQNFSEKTLALGNLSQKLLAFLPLIK